jgi:hypothetical protein
VFDSEGVTASAALSQELRLAQVRPLAELVAGRLAGALPVADGLASILPDGLRRGSTVEVSGGIGTMSLVLALLAGPSEQGSWSAAVGFPLLCADAAADHGIDLSRFALVPHPGADWTTVVGALLDSLDVVAVRLPRPPARLTDVDARRLAARARQRGSVLIPIATGRRADGTGGWPTADVRLSADLAAADGSWSGIGSGHGRLQQRRLLLHANGRGAAARPRSSTVWLPDRGGATGPAESPVSAISTARISTARMSTAR